jgi:superfamily II DNA helicase RecQ
VLTVSPIQEAEFKKLGLHAVAINSRTLQEARYKGEDLWRKAREGTSILLLSPEQLISSGFEALLLQDKFWNRLCALGVDEIHLLDTWGQEFRKAFQQIGYMYARLPHRTTLIATTATLLAGPQTARVCSFLNIDPDFHLIHRSNVRPDLQILFRTLTTGLGGWTFPDLRWVLNDKRTKIIFVPTISLGHHIMIDLWRYIPKMDQKRRVRVYHAGTFHSYNMETRTLLRDGVCQIIIATNILMVGINFLNIADVLVIKAKDPNECHQKVGRAGRDSSLVNNPRGIIYLTKKEIEDAEAIINGSQKKTSKAGKSPNIEMSSDFARMITSACKIRQQDLLYANPIDKACSCQTCASKPRVEHVSCNCSGCLPDNVPVISKNRSRRTMPRGKRPSPKTSAKLG